MSAKAKAHLSAEGEGRFALSGALDFDTVPELLAQSESQFAQGSAVTVSWREVEQLNSAALALLVEWLAWQTQQRVARIAFEDLPQQLLSLAQACGVDTLLHPHTQAAHNA